MNTRFFNLLIMTFIPLATVMGQMNEGRYPYQIIDSVVYINHGSELWVDSIDNTNHFTPFKESQEYLFEIFDHYSKPGLNFSFDENKGEIKINISKNNYELLKNIGSIKQKYLEFHNRKLIGSFANSTNDTILFPTKYNHVIAVLEAKDCIGNWAPIEYCLDSHYDIGGHLEVTKLAPKQSILFSINDNFGETKTIMRLRLLGNDTLIISNEFEGSVNSNVFKLPTKLDNKVYSDSTIFLKEPIFGKLENIHEEIEIIDFEE